MGTLYCKISKLIELIDLNINAVVCSSCNVNTANTDGGIIIDKELLSTLGEVLPDVISLYNLPEMAEYKDDQLYWGEQLKRILKAYEIKDVFLVVDALKNELAANLSLLQNIMVEKNIEC